MGSSDITQPMLTATQARNGHAQPQLRAGNSSVRLQLRCSGLKEEMEFGEVKIRCQDSGLRTTVRSFHSYIRFERLQAILAPVSRGHASNILHKHLGLTISALGYPKDSRPKCGFEASCFKECLPRSFEPQLLHFLVCRSHKSQCTSSILESARAWIRSPKTRGL